MAWRGWDAVALVMLMAGWAAAQEAAESAPAPSPSAAANLRVEEIVLNIQRQVSQVRGLPIKAPLKSKLMTHEELIAFAREELAKQYEDFDAFDYFLRAWGCMPMDTPPLMDLLLVSLREQVGGIYDPGSKTLFILQGFDPQSTVGKVILAHEIGHALQDQHFDLAKGIEDRLHNEDALLALQAVFEGDATLLMTEYTVDAGESLDARSILSLLQTTQGQFYQMPYFIQQMFLQPYLTGMTFYVHILYGEDLPRNRPFEQPPLSTEQVLHPEKYHGDLRDDPTSVTLAARPGLEAAGWTRSRVNTMGELQIKLLMDTWHGLAQGKRYAEGWDGDAYSFWHKGTEIFSEWRSVWDSPKDAGEFYDGLLDMMQRRKSTALEFAAWGERPGANAEPDTDALLRALGLPPARGSAADAVNLKQSTPAAGAFAGMPDSVAIIEGPNWRFAIARQGEQVYAALLTPAALRDLK